MAINSPPPSDNPNTGPQLPGATGAQINAAIKGIVAASHEGTAATYASRGKLAESTFDCLQSLVDYSAGILAFMVGQGKAGFSFNFEGNNFTFGGRFNTPLGSIGNRPFTGVSFDAGFRNVPGQVTISPPNTQKGTTSTGPSGGVRK